MGIGKQQLRRQYLREQLALARKATDALRYSHDRIQASLPLPAEIPEELAVQLEALTARFARLADLLIQKLFRAQDAMLLEDEGTLLDRLNRAEKRGVIHSVEQWREIRELRNQIAHEYVLSDLRELFEAVIRVTPVLLETVAAVERESR